MNTKKSGNHTFPRSTIAGIQVFLTSKDLGFSLGEAKRTEIWKIIGAKLSIEFYSWLLAMCDNHRFGHKIEANFNDFILDSDFKRKIEAWVTFGDRTPIAPQCALLAIRTILENPEIPDIGIIAPTKAHLQLLYCALLDLSTGVDMKLPYDAEEVQSRISTEIFANHHFNRIVPLEAQITNFADSWDSQEIIMHSHDGIPTEVEIKDFVAQLTGITNKDRLTLFCLLMAPHIANNKATHQLENDSLNGTTVSKEQHDLLRSIGAPRQLIASEIRKNCDSDWNFHWLRRYPIVFLSETSFTIPRLQFLADRMLGSTLLLELEHKVGLIGGKKSSNQLTQFYEQSFEKSIGQLLTRIFKNRHCRIDTEQSFYKNWSASRPKSNKPRICDFIVTCKDRTILFDATASRVSSQTTFGNAGVVGIDSVLEKVLERKLKQFESTVNQIRQNPHFFVNGPHFPNNILRLVVVPEYGLGWDPATFDRFKQRFSQHEAPTKLSTQTAVITRVDLYYLEYLAESNGSKIGDFLFDWQSGAFRNLPLSVYLSENGFRLFVSKRRRNATSRALHDAASFINGIEKDSCQNEAKR